MELKTETVQSTTVDIPRFGTLTYAEPDVYESPWGLPGFPDCRRWLMLALDSQPGFVWLQSLDDPDVALPAACPWSIFDDYAPDLPPHAFSALGIKDATEFTLLCVTVVSPDAREMTMNLDAPVLLNLRTRKALQLVLGGDERLRRVRIPRTHETADAALAAKAS